MSALGQPTDNPFAERVMRTIKEEEVYLNEYRDLTDARLHLGRFIEDVYQVKRVHSALVYLTPSEFETASGTNIIRGARRPAVPVGSFAFAGSAGDFGGRWPLVETEP